jgi:hypothetical protein
MKIIAAALCIAFTVAACGPATGIPLAAAQPAAAAALWHAPVGADPGGQVVEYH